MRWDGEVKHAELTPVRVWSKRDEGNFGGRPLLDEDNSLSHHGIPGMKWGVRTKEYVKKGYDTLKRRMAIQKMQRKAEAKKQDKANYDEGYQRGKRVAANTYFIKKKVQKVLDKKAEKNKERFTDKMVDKAFNKLLDKTGIGETAKQYAQQLGLEEHLNKGLDKARDWLKDQKDGQINNLYDFAQSDKGKELLQKAANVIGKAASKSIGFGQMAAPHIREGLRYAGQAARSGLKSAAKGAWNAAKSGRRYLHQEGYRRIGSGIRNAEKMMSRLATVASNKIREGEMEARSRLNMGSRMLDELLARRSRRFR